MSAPLAGALAVVALATGCGAGSTGVTETGPGAIAPITVPNLTVSVTLPAGVAPLVSSITGDFTLRYVPRALVAQVQVNDRVGQYNEILRRVAPYATKAQWDNAQDMMSHAGDPQFNIIVQRNVDTLGALTKLVSQVPVTAVSLGNGLTGYRYTPPGLPPGSGWQTISIPQGPTVLVDVNVKGLTDDETLGIIKGMGAK